MIEVMFKMRPYPEPVIPGTNARHIRKVEIKLLSITLRKSAKEKSTKGLRMLIPALLIRICTGPNFSVTARATAATSFSWVTSPLKATAVPLCALIASRTDSRRFWSRATRMILAPAFARAFAIASPRPRFPPVITAVFPVKSIVIFIPWVAPDWGESFQLQVLAAGLRHKFVTFLERLLEAALGVEI